MSCSDCKSKNNCNYEPLEEWEEGFCYPPCCYLSDYHVDYISDHRDRANSDYEF